MAECDDAFTPSIPLTRRSPRGSRGRAAVCLPEVDRGLGGRGDGLEVGRRGGTGVVGRHAVHDGVAAVVVEEIIV